ncbi:hypothetical protein KAW38_03440, partial [Candidatus Micrarchaeota archaeon]|nr:hypothetical protein [Candidatus Micrarchaeota archaeon]
MKEFKELKEKTEEKKVPVKEKFGKKQVMDYERAEIKKLHEGDAEIAHNIMKKCMFDVNIYEIKDILKKGMSYGAFVGRMLVGVGLGWEVYYNHESKGIEDGLPNAIYLEDDALLLAYEGQGIREM